ncbi:flagellar basal-body rod protein FlgB [Paenibacillus anaericanus]|uniref:flagellar basal body rod protein FlgB n=1 Tax=Paenibacillus anaericanus TaxID=170367 RepID=UPI0027868E32|nr:flagellar basal body rod protein FlgB [Paenibacillus anaericanus]MDQ0090631.1 flagellar basal-body rod protein FlgB [Paenibacillus anaericanus]
MQILSGVGFQRLEAAIDAANIRQSVISNNIANEDTPYFKRSSVSFESLLQDEMNSEMPTLRGRTTNPRHFVIGPSSSSIPDSQVITDETTSMNNNLNNVDIDSEMSLLAENQLRYNSYIELLNYQIKMKQTAISK